MHDWARNKVKAAGTAENPASAHKILILCTLKVHAQDLPVIELNHCVKNHDDVNYKAISRVSQCLTFQCHR